MSLMAGFDLIMELSTAGISKLIRSIVQLGGGPISAMPGTPLNPPFEYEFPIRSGIINAQAHFLVVGDLDVRLTNDRVGNPFMTLTLPFRDTSIMGIVDGTSRSFLALDGHIIITGQIQVPIGALGLSFVQFNFVNTSINIAYSLVLQREI